MTERRQFRSLRRRVETRIPLPKIVIYSEGEKTEFEYFDEMRRGPRSVLLDIDIIEGAGVPLTIAKRAATAAQLARVQNARQSYAKRDEFWAVFDRDEHPNIPEAFARCREAGVNVAFSDPCFELWLILHYQDYDRPDHRHDVQRRLETLCADYDRKRRKSTACDKLMPLITEAEKRAEKQLARRNEEGSPPSAPFTTVFELTRRIRAT